MKPKPVSDAELAFPANVKKLMPFDHPEWRDYRNRYSAPPTWGFKLFDDMFYFGIQEIELNPEEGIDPKLAFRHIRAIMASFEPKHEDKTCACALLFEKWFKNDAKWTRSPKQ